MIAIAHPCPVEIVAATAAEPASIRTQGGGPRTPEGKERSRRNALKHGLRAKVLLPDDLADAVAGRSEEFAARFAPATAYEQWLIEQMALTTARLDRCAELSVADLQRRVDRAALCWDSDRRMAVEELGSGLAKAPARVARALARTRQGVDWLLERWEALGEILRRRGAWDDAQRRLALDLLGTPEEVRSCSRLVPPDAEAPALLALVEAQVAALREGRAAVLDELDESEREMARQGMPLDEDATSARLRRYESSCRRALQWALAEFRRVHPEPEPAPKPAASAPRPIPTPPPCPAARVEAAPAPRPALTPAPAPVLSRRARRFKEKLARQSARRADRVGAAATSTS